MASIIYFGGQLLVFPVQAAGAPYALKALFSLVPQVAMQLTATVFGEYESSFIGVQFSNIFITVDNYSFVVGIVMLFFSFWLWLLFGLYLDAVLPKTYGDRLPVCFCCTRKFWCGRRRNGEERYEDDE